jgi:DNA-binding response OmpR family regulator
VRVVSQVSGKYLICACFVNSLETKAANSTETVLLAEDEEKMARLLKQVLSQAGYRIVIAADGHEAIDLFCRYKQEIDVVVLDTAYPKIAEWDVIGKLKETNPAVNIVVASNAAE